MEQKKYELEDRFVEFTCTMIGLGESLPDTRSGGFMAEQLMKSCHSPAFSYGEAQSAESRNDFIAKMEVILHELKDCRTALKIIRKREMVKPVTKMDAMFEEAEVLIAIVGKSISTAKKNKLAKSTAETE